MALRGGDGSTMPAPGPEQAPCRGTCERRARIDNMDVLNRCAPPERLLVLQRGRSARDPNRLMRDPAALPRERDPGDIIGSGVSTLEVFKAPGLPPFITVAAPGGDVDGHRLSQSASVRRDGTMPATMRRGLTRRCRHGGRRGNPPALERRHPKGTTRPLQPWCGRWQACRRRVQPLSLAPDHELVLDFQHPR
jgi:hypothetical protein